MTPQLPPELVRAILEESLRDLNYLWGIRQDNERTTMLRKYSSVNNVFREIAKEQSWSRLVIDRGNVHQWIANVESETNRHLRRLIRRIRVWGVDAISVERLLKLTPWLEEIHIGGISKFSLSELNHLKRTCASYYDTSLVY